MLSRSEQTGLVTEQAFELMHTESLPRFDLGERIHQRIVESAQCDRERAKEAVHSLIPFTKWFPRYRW